MAKFEPQWSGRRRAARYLFYAPTEITNIPFTRLLRAPTGDLSRFGCYIETDKPFPRETLVKIKIAHNGQLFNATGRVAFHTNDGMGIGFFDVDPADQAILDSWLPTKLI